MKKNPLPYQKTIFVCTNTRADGRVACANPGRGGDTLCEKLKAYVKAAGLKKKVRVARSGCLDLCSQGPNLVVWPEGVWYKEVTEQDLTEIIQNHLTPEVDSL